MFLRYFLLFAFVLPFLSAQEVEGEEEDGVDTGFDGDLWCVGNYNGFFWVGHGNHYTPYILFSDDSCSFAGIPSCFPGDPITFTPTTRFSKYGQYSPTQGANIVYQGNGKYIGTANVSSTLCDSSLADSFTCVPLGTATRKKLIDTCNALPQCLNGCGDGDGKKNATETL